MRFLRSSSCYRVLVPWLALGLMLPITKAAEKSPIQSMEFTSSAFSEGQTIPAKYTGDGSNVSPPLKWSGTPANTKSLALIADDPDAPVGTWVHWVLFDLPSTVSELPENIGKSQFVQASAKQGVNDFGHLGYGGPAPPRGKPHRYFFKLYALDKELGLKPGSSKKEVERAMEGHILAEGKLIGTYQRR